MHPTLRKIILSALRIGIGAAVFRLSFDAQVTLAIASGIDPDLAWLYPFGVDAAILMGVLIMDWVPNMTEKLRKGLNGAIASWTAISIAGNAFHVAALPPGRVTVPLLLAIAVNMVPAITLFAIIHLSSPNAINPPAPAPATTTTARRSPKTQAAVERSHVPAARTDIPPISDETLLELIDERVPYSKIAKDIGRSKSYVGTQAQRVLRDRAEREAASA